MSKEFKNLIKEKKKAISDLEMQVGGYKMEIRKLRQDIQKLEVKAKRPKVLEMTDHSYVRYYQRVLMMSMDDVIERVHTEVGRDLPDGEFPTEWGVFVIKNNTVITIKPKRK